MVIEPLACLGMLASIPEWLIAVLGALGASLACTITIGTCISIGSCISIGTIGTLCGIGEIGTVIGTCVSIGTCGLVDIGTLTISGGSTGLSGLALCSNLISNSTLCSNICSGWSIF